MIKTAIIFLALFILPHQLAAETSWKAGVASVNITPDRPLLMAGYASRDRPAEGKLTDLNCKALAIEDAKGNRAVLITVDLVGVGRDFTNLIRRELRARYRLGKDQIMICTSHTHTGPVVIGNLRPMYRTALDAASRNALERYASSTQSKIVSAVHQALNNMRPSVLKWGSGQATFATNRRNNGSDSDVRKARTNKLLQGPFDHDVPVLAVYDLDDQQKLRTVVFGYACHATVLSFYQWSGDYPGFAQIELEQQLPGVTAMFWAGCGADQNPLPRRSVALAKHYGRQLATSVESVLLTSEMQPLNPTLRTTYDEIDLPFAEIPDADHWRSLTENKNPYAAARAQIIVEQLEAGIPIAKTYPFPIGCWNLGGEVDWIFLGGEVVVDYSLSLKAEHSGLRTWVAGYTNDVMAYIPSRRILREGGYEGGGAMVYYGLPAPWDETVEGMIATTVGAQIAKNKITLPVEH